MAHMTDALIEDLRELETRTKLDQRYVLFLTTPMKLTLSELSRTYHVSMADVVRAALPTGLRGVYPEFETIYNKHLKTET